MQRVESTTDPGSPSIRLMEIAVFCFAYLQAAPNRHICPRDCRAGTLMSSLVLNDWPAPLRAILLKRPVRSGSCRPEMKELFFFFFFAFGVVFFQFHICFFFALFLRCVYGTPSSFSRVIYFVTVRRRSLNTCVFNACTPSHMHVYISMYIFYSYRRVC